jgi:hypothetical protein
MLADAHWMRLEPLIEACRPKGKTPPQDLRRRLSGAGSRRSSGGIRTEPSGGPSRLTWVPGHLRLRLSSAGRAWACGRSCFSSPRREACNSG